MINISYYYTLSLLENDCDVSVYSRERCLLSKRNLCVSSRFAKRISGLTHTGCTLQCISFGALGDVTIVLGMRRSIHIIHVHLGLT